MELGIAQVRGILPRGGTILGSSRTNLVKIDGGIERTEENLRKLGIDALIAIGGEDTLGVATTLTEHGFHVIGVPKTIDNDLSATDYTFGFDTAVQIATEAIDRLHTTAESHHRILICEVMGRHAGWIALHSGMAGGANAILIPEVEFDLDEVVGWVESRFKASYAPIIVVAEGALPKGGKLVTKDATGKEARAVVLGHIQRGGTPSSFDRVLATRFGLNAITAVKDEAWGTMVALQGTDIVRVPLQAATEKLKTVPIERYNEAKSFFG